MSLFKKSGEGFLAKLFKHKQVEELAHTYAAVNVRLFSFLPTEYFYSYEKYSAL